MFVSFGQIEGYSAVVLDGRLSAGNATLLRDAMLKAAAEQPDALVCDLRGAQADTSALTVLLVVADRIQDWPTMPLVALCDSEDLRDRLTRVGVARRVPIAGRADELGGVVRRCPGLLRSSTRLPATVDAPAVARSFVRDTLVRWQVPQYVDVARLIADELATKAVLHTGRSSTLSASLTGTRIGIAVADQGSGPATGTVPPARTGLGLVLVDELSDRWGVLPRVDGGHVTWAVIGGGRSRFTAVPAQVGSAH
jgi:anti-sigma regulatory factor (Ser/Thr protein kinase)